MPTTATTTFGINRLVPLYRGADAPALIQHYALPASTGSSTSPIKAGTILGELTGNAVQTVTVNGSPTGGTFTVTYAGQTTAATAYNASAATLQTNLRALSTIGSSGCTVAGSNGGPYTVTFTNALGEQAVALMTANGAALTGGTSPTVTVVTATAGVAGQVNSYASGNSDGTQAPRVILEYDCWTDSSGNHFWGGGFFSESLPSVPCFVSGFFRAEDLTGLDATALTQTGTRVTQVSGTIYAGVVKLG